MSDREEITRRASLTIPILVISEALTSLTMLKNLIEDGLEAFGGRGGESSRSVIRRIGAVTHDVWNRVNQSILPRWNQFL